MKRNENLPLNLIEKMNARVSLIASVIALTVICIVFNRIDYYMIRMPAQEAVQTMQQNEKSVQTGNEAAVSTTSVSVVAVGDNLITESLLGSGRYNSGQWNYDHLYTQVKSLIQGADVAVVNQETPFTSSHEQVSGSEPYATPTEVGDALVEAGFDVVSLATEYMARQGQELLTQTMDYWNSQPQVQTVGITDTNNPSRIKIIESGGIRLAFLNYCLPIQGMTIQLTSTGSYQIPTFEQEKVASAVASAKEEADCVIFCAHWGRNQEPMPTEYEKEWAAFLLRQGVDVVLGSFPGVLSPYVTLMDNAGHSMLIYYSLGGFISTGDTLKQLLSGMASFTIQKTTDASGSRVSIQNPDLIPLVMHVDYDQGEYGVYRLSDYTETMAQNHSVISYFGEDFSVNRLNTKLDEILSMHVIPSEKTGQLDAVFDEAGNMYSTDGSYLEDTDSITSVQYYENLSNNN